MALLRRIGRFLSLAAVLIVAIVAGLFLSGCRREHIGGPARKPPAEPTAEPDQRKKEDTRKADKPRRVDVDETEKGQPVPRNMLE